MNLEFTNEYNIVKRKDVRDLPSIFLAGPVVKGGSYNTSSWRKEAIDILEKLKYKGNVFIPEMRDINPMTMSKTEMHEMHLWEWRHLNLSDVIVFWVPRDIKGGTPAFTTNVEFGFWMGSDSEKVVYGRPNEADGNEYLDDLYEYYGFQYGISHTLESTLVKAIMVLIKTYSRIEPNNKYYVSDMIPYHDIVEGPGKLKPGIFDKYSRIYDNLIRDYKESDDE